MMGESKIAISDCPVMDLDFMVSVPMASMIVDQDGCIQKINPKALELLKQCLDQSNGQIFQAVKADSLISLFPNLTDSCSKLLDRKSSAPMAAETWDQKTGSISLKIHACLFPSFSERPRELLLFLHDAKSFDHDQKTDPDLSSLLANLPGAAYRCHNDHLWTMEYISEGCLELTGYHARDLIGNKKTSFNAITHPDDREKIWNKIQEALAEKTGFSLVYRVITAEGREKWVMEKGQGLWNPQGGLNYLEGFISDISEKKEAEDNRRKMDAQLQKVQRLESLGVLAGGIAHDFNNLLVGVLGNAELALYELAEENKAHGFVLKIQNAAKQLAELTNQLLAYSGKGKFVVLPLNLNKMIEDMASLLSTVAGKNVELNFDLATDLPDIEADAAQVRQVLVNILSNAAESISQTGEIKIKTNFLMADLEYLNHTLLADNTTPGVYVCLEVKDTGSGMDAATVNKIFDPFFSTKFQGRGLGLAAVLGIVRSHNGTIKVESLLGGGTTVRVLFSSSEEKKSADKANNFRAQHKNRPKTVLVVDDEPMVLDLAKGALNRSGISVLTAGDGLEGLEIFKDNTEKIDLVLLDMTMPRMDGGTFFKKIMDLKKDAKVILSSGFTLQEASRRFQNPNLAGFIQKPYLPSQLVKLVNKTINK
jgi:PAS domain S-box-containing protein